MNKCKKGTNNIKCLKLLLSWNKWNLYEETENDVDLIRPEWMTTSFEKILRTLKYYSFI